MVPLISIIVPVYNVEKYINKCVDSIINQTYKNIEIILIDDGSTDKSGEICNQYALFDSRIKIVHKQNGGLSSARNAGIDIANGEFLMFIDSDDYIEKNMVETLYNLIADNNADLAICSFNNVDENYNLINIHIPIKDEILSNEEAIKKLISTSSWSYVISCNKLYRKDIFNTIRFPEGKIHEDEYTIHHILHASDKVVCTSKKLYNYLRRNSSISKSFGLNRVDAVFALEDRLRFLQQIGENKIYDYTMWSYAARLNENIKRIKKFHPSETSLIKELKAKLSCSYKYLIKSKFIPLKSKVSTTLRILGII